MNETWQELKTFLLRLRNLPVSTTMMVGGSGFCISTGCSMESWVFLPEKIHSMKLVEKTKRFFREQNVSFMWPVFAPADKYVLGNSLGLNYAGDLTGMIYEPEADCQPEISDESVEPQKVNFRDWAKTAWHAFGGEYDDVPENYFELVKAFDEDKNFSLHLYEDKGSFMLNHSKDWIGVYYFAVIPEERRKGIARSMMNEICKLSGGKKILLQATPMGLPFYENFGFKELCKIPVYSDSEDVF